MSDDEKKKAIASLIFLTEKIDGTIKARQCADCQTQRGYIKKEVTTGAVFLTCIADAKEEREVAVVNLPGAFLHVDNEDDVVMFMRGTLAELMVMVAPQTVKSLSLQKIDKRFCM